MTVHWGDLANVQVLTNDGAPVDGSTGVGASPGALCIDTTNHDVYINTGTEAAPVWSVLCLTEAWDDLRIVPSAFDFAGSADPALADWQPGGAGVTFKVWEFTTGDEAFFTIQLPHAYKAGTDLKPHVHWTPGDRGTAESGKTVAWKLDYAIANVNGVFAAQTAVNLTDTCSGANDKHEIGPSGIIPGTGLTLSAMLVCRLYRDTGDTWATNTAGNCPILLELDFHYQIDAPGSRQELIK